MKIALIGYGKMGKKLEKMAQERGHEISVIYSSENPFETSTIKNADVAIEFSRPELVLKHIQHALALGLPLIVGTTGWNLHINDVRTWVAVHRGSLLYASNFSLGVHMFNQLAEQLARMVSCYDQYALRIEEIHHTQKLDSPSGTAITLAERVIAQHSALNSWEETSFNQPGVLPIKAHRIPNVPGTHSLHAKSVVDSITITHEAHNRDGFALGAIVAAEFLLGKQGLFTMDDVLNFTP